MKKVLFVATVVKTHIMEFHIPYLKMFKEEGWETAVASKNDYENPEDCKIPFCDTYYDIPFERFPLKMRNIQSYKLLKSIINEQNYDIIHCHTPVGAMLARLAAISTRKKGTKVIYTAHGFHFFKGAPLINWLIYYPVEWICSFMTDTLITINQEDYLLAKKHMHAKKIEYVPGVGIDLNKFNIGNLNKINERKKLNIPENAKILLSVGEVNKNKNHETVIRALKQIDNSNLYYLIVGRGVLMDDLKKLIVELNLEQKVFLLGYRQDVKKFYSISDVFVFPSFREGLSVALMEAMACKLPVICSKIRGNTDLIDNDGGLLINPNSVNDFENSIKGIFMKDLKTLGEYNSIKIKKFDIKVVIGQVKKIYEI